ncbi:MAG: hypothetical protein JXA03_00445 [Bacteroidales bacterium]|nr:hypothetical protein [Bacteroidales bacterium]
MKADVKKILNYYSEKKQHYRLNKKISKICAHLREKKAMPDPGHDLTLQHIARWSPLSKKVNTDWLKVYTSITGIPSPDYIPESIYYNYVEPVLNNKFFSIAFRDKNYYGLLYRGADFPEVYMRNIDGLFYDGAYNRIIDPEKYFQSLREKELLIVKPSFITGGGHQISLLKYGHGGFIDQEGKQAGFDAIQAGYQRNYLVQQYIRQHEFTGRFNKSSLNTLRLLTYRSVTDDRIHVLHTVLRIGRKGSITDNQAGGGIAIGVNKEGQISGYGVDKKGNKYPEYNGIEFSGAGKIPEFEEMKKTVIHLAKDILYSRLIGWDVSLDEHGKIKVIEMNNIHNEINFYQMNNGPLFLEFTGEVIDHCQKNPTTYSMNFYND